MTKTPLIKRMTKGGAAKTWIREVEAKDRLIERREATIDEYGNYIDQLVRHYQTAIYQIERAIAQLITPLIVESDMNYIQVRLAAESVVFQLEAYIEGEK